jgi:murein DD-endopeptidase MepM/ murein hydrolase activator NlpD
MNDLTPAPVTAPRRRTGRVVAVAALLLAVAVGGALLIHRLSVKPPPCGPVLPCADSLFSGYDTLGSGEVLAGVLSRWCVPAERVNAVYAALGRTDFGFRSMRPGEGVVLRYRGLELVGVSYHKDLVTSYNVTFESAGASATKELKPVDTVLTVVRGTVKGSLWNSLVEQGHSPALVVRFAEILSYEVDFLTEVQDGDTYEILLDQCYVDSVPWREGRVFAVHYRGSVGNFYGCWYQPSAGHWDYYNEKGQSLRKTVLRSPLSFARVTSHFGRRFHPISRVYREHHGVDYGAPTGTPVSAIADGTVVRAGWNGGYGNFVQLRHAGGLASCYGHLSRYGAGIKAGRSVRQGQTVGYVGSTGFSTGPHLHFEVRRGGSPVNPLKVIPPRAEPVPARLMADYQRVRGDYIAKLGLPAGPIRPASDTTAAR